MLASGRFTLRLIVDGTVSYAFVPLCELIAFVIPFSVLNRFSQILGSPGSRS